MRATASYSNAENKLLFARPRPWLMLCALLAACSTDGAAHSPRDCRAEAADCACDERQDCEADDEESDTEPVASRDAGKDASKSQVPPRDGGGASEVLRDASSSPAARSDASSTSDGPRDAGTSDASVSSPNDASTDAGKPATDAATASDAGEDATGGGTGFVSKHGALRVSGNRVVDRAGQPIQLRGMSLFWSQWSTYYTAKSVDVLVDDWKATVVRAALGVENEGGYLTAAQDNVAKVRAVVDRAIARDLYVIIDWHDHHAQDHVAQATTFFEEMARAYGKQPHVIFEIYNEPMDTSWSVVKTYAEQMIGKIRKAGSDNLIIVGTPNWSQDVDVAAEARITSDVNVAYTLHFYAATHKQALRDKAKTALDRGIALFVTEWGSCSADGNGTVDEAETRTWLSFLSSQKISWANWALNDKAEACSALKSAAGPGPWRDDQLTQSGLLVKRAIP